ncbi:MAG: hypothetical protein J5I93_04980 [Pirellulaceae bacterium]|nr:hypothetical protein [Pirellulaceae bacterium]
MFWVWMTVGAVASVLAAILLQKALSRWRVAAARRQLTEQRGRFQRRREWLEARFLTLASQSGSPRGLAWVDCEFDNAVAFARDRGTGELRALVGVTIRFEAIEGGGMEDVEAVGNLRAATAVFRWHRGDWETDGRAVFNLNPAETIRRYQHELETVD